MKDKKIEFERELANLLEKHQVYICSNRTCDYSEIVFLFKENLEFINLNRFHISAYDLRCDSGMSSKEANDLYRKHKQL